MKFSFITTASLLMATVVAAEDSDTTVKNSKTTATTNSLSIVPSTSNTKVVVTVGESTSTSGTTTTSSSSSSSSKTTSSESVTSYVTEGSADKALLKIVLTKDNNSETYYNGIFRVGSDTVELRIDTLQPDLWVMNANDIYNCSYFDDEINEELSSYGTGYFETASTGIATETICAQGGEYTTSTDQIFPSPEPSLGIYNQERYDLPYINGISANGVLLTDTVAFLSSRDYLIWLGNFTFADVNDTNVYYGGVGLAGNPTGSGFLDTLTNLGLIKSPSYSMWFYNDTGDSYGIGELILGAVDTKYLDGSFLEFDMLPHTGPKFTGGRSDLIDRLRLPIIAVDDILVQNSDSGQSTSLSSDAGTIPVALDSRSAYSFLPLSVIINLAVQTNALYSSTLDRWIVDCTLIRDLNAYIEFDIGSLTVQVPLNKFLTNAFVDTQQLTYSSGAEACYLMVLPSTNQGFSSLGLPFLTSIYLAVDNASGKIAIANVNQNVSIALDDFTQTASSLFAASAYTATASNFTSTSADSISSISSNHIPFATAYSSSANLTLTYSIPSATGDGESIPARFSGATILSGEIIMTNSLQGSYSGASASSAGTTEAMGSNLKVPWVFVKGANISAVWTIAVTFVGAFALIVLL
ncbi:hypothetical protein CLIB1423_07S04742 [[Candida] railenensis]|uniref:Peptidase A1 domain-containing protein n=1 Tax=[Candida] railenensis TaxID=45579 RepID=A0A9P0QNU6_9ASCO|nr:hypothetical protein CLIB1423_07S04742 [[Candida] railenensis]